jgi:hypothetical protein
MHPYQPSSSPLVLKSLESFSVMQSRRCISDVAMPRHQMFPYSFSPGLPSLIHADLQSPFVHEELCLLHRSPVGSPLSTLSCARQPVTSASFLPPLRSHLEGLADTLEDLCDLFTDRTAPIQLVIVTGPPGSGNRPLPTMDVL